MLQRFSLFFICLSAIATAFAQGQPKNIVDEVIWVVGDQPILLSEVENYRLESDLMGQSITDPYGKIPEQFAIQKLYLHQAEIDSITVPEADLQRAADNEISRYTQRAGSREALENYFHKTLPQLREMFKEQERIKNLTYRVRDKLTSHVKVTPAEVREYFSKLPTDSLPLIPTQVEVQIITARPKIAREEVERIEAHLREFARRVNDGETDFARLAKMYSQDGSSRNGGEMGFMGRNMLVPEFANVAFSLNDPKKVSKIVKTDFGYHIIQLIEKRNDKVNVRHILLRPEVTQQEYDRNLAHLDSIGDDIRGGKFSFEDAARELSDDKDTRNNHGLMVFNSFDPEDEETIITSRFQMKDLPQDVAKVVDNLKVGEVSKAFRMTDEKTGSEICAIVKLKNRIEGHHANMTEDFQVLRKVVMQKRKNAAIQKWLAEKIKSTYVRISPEWRNHKFEYEGWVK